MRPILIGLLLVLTTVAASAQGMGGGGGKHHRPEQKSGAPKKPVDDTGYKASLKSIPDKAYDPWKSVR